MNAWSCVWLKAQYGQSRSHINRADKKELTAELVSMAEECQATDDDRSLRRRSVEQVVYPDRPRLGSLIHYEKHNDKSSGS